MVSIQVMVDLFLFYVCISDLTRSTKPRHMTIFVVSFWQTPVVIVSTNGTILSMVQKHLSRCLPGFIGKLYFTSIDWMLNDYSSLILGTILIMVQTYPPIPLSMCSKSHQFTLACQSWKTTSQCMFDQHQAMIRLHEIISCHQPLPVNINRWSVCPLLLTEFMNVCDNVVILFANSNCRVENLGIFILFQNFRMS